MLYKDYDVIIIFFFILFKDIVFIYMELRVWESVVNFCFLNVENVKNFINKLFFDFNKFVSKIIYI